MTIDIKEGVEFVLSHSERQFPRRIFTPRTKQMTVYSIEEMVMIFELNDLLDCRINVYPSYSMVLEGHHPPDVLFIDLDMKTHHKNGRPLMNPELTLRNRLRKTLERINSYFGGGEFHPSIIASGSGGNHIIQPLDSVDLKKFWYKDRLLFMGFGCNPNVQFLRFLEPLYVLGLIQSIITMSAWVTILYASPARSIRRCIKKLRYYKGGMANARRSNTSLGTF